MPKIKELSDMSEKSWKFEQNKLNGMIAELIATTDFRENGFQIKRTGLGSDFIAYKNIPNQVRPYQMYVEVKYNKAELSPLQQKQKFSLRRQKIDYFLYRVTPAQLENFKEEHGVNSENFDPEILRQGIYNFNLSYKNSKIKIVLPWKCPCCKEVNAITETELVKNFGLRNMGNNIIRNQSWCKKCRSK